jgi:hypothetical protein
VDQRINHRTNRISHCTKIISLKQLMEQGGMMGRGMMGPMGAKYGTNLFQLYFMTTPAALFVFVEPIPAPGIVPLRKTPKSFRNVP